jgi:hypothetical protein
MGSYALVLLRTLAEGAAPRIEGVSVFGEVQCGLTAEAFRDAGRGDLHFIKLEPGQTVLLSPEAIRQFDQLLNKNT